MVSEMLERENAERVISQTATSIGALRAENLLKSYRRRCVVNRSSDCLARMEQERPRLSIWSSVLRSLMKGMFG
jgi:hypothetical protein